LKLLKTRIKDFQSLKDIEIEHGNLTIISGPSDIGKSAIVRAIRSLYRNTASPEDVKFGSTKLRVEQEFDDGSIVGYERSKTVNRYILNGTEFNKVGREIPDAVKEFLKADELNLDKDQSLDLNISSQFEGPFLLADSSTLITKVISSLSGIHYIYSALREATTQSQRLKAQATGLEANIKGLEKYDVYAQESDNLSNDLSLVEKTANKIEGLEAEIAQLKGIYAHLKDLNSKYVDPAPQAEELNALSNNFTLLSQIKTRTDVLIELSNKLNIANSRNLSEIPNSWPVIVWFNQASELMQEIERLKSLSSRKKSINDFEVVDLVDRLGKLNTVFLSLQTKEMGYNGCVEINNSLNKVVYNGAEINTEISLLSMKETEIKGKIKVCPTCLRAL
jgi:DNA repair ATPase RecN